MFYMFCESSVWDLHCTWYINRHKAFSVSQLEVETSKSIHMYVPVQLGPLPYQVNYTGASVAVDILLVVIFLKLKECFQRKY